MTATFPFRIAHQFRAEWRHHRGWIIAWIAWMLLLWAYRSQGEESFASTLMVGDLMPLITVLLAATIAWRCVSSDSPSNTDSATLTRPIGQSALWLGKLAFLACAVVLPLLLTEMTTWTGFGHSSTGWLALIASVLLAAALVIGIAGAVTSLTSSTAQVIATAVLGVLGAGLWLALGLSYSHTMNPAVDHIASAQGARTAGSIVAAFVTGLGAMAAWWIATVPRRRCWAAALLLLSLLQAPLLTASWPVDWITPPPQSYPQARLAVKTGRADPADKTPGRALWPTLRITGLGKDEVASIIDFAPILENGQEWPPLGSYTDLLRSNTGYESWLHLDHLRALLKHSPPTTLWQHSLNNQVMYNGRKKIQDAILPLRLDPQAMPARWRLRLAVHEMRRVTTLPLQQLWTQDTTIILRPGLRAEFHPFAFWLGMWRTTGRLHHMHPRLLRPQDHAPTLSQGAPLADALLLVFEDPELRENAAYSIGLQQPAQPPALQVDVSQGFSLTIQPPAAQHYLLKTTHQDWVNRLNATLWYAEERGTVDLELTAAQMTEVLAPPPAAPPPAPSR